MRLRLLAGYVLPPAIAICLLLAGWEIWVRLAHTKEYILPAPSAVLARLFSQLGFFLRAGMVTLYEALAGFALGASVALLLAVAMAHSRLLERALFPLALLVKVTPVVAIAPLLAIWMGFGPIPKILIAALLSFFPILVNAIVGFRSVNPGSLDFVRSLAASPVDIFLRLRLPSSLPYLFAAFRITIPLAVIGAVVGEWFSSQSGLGYVILVAHSNLNMPTLFAAVLTLALLGIALTLLLSALERRFLFWHESNLG